MFGKKTELLTTEEKLRAVRKMSDDELIYMENKQELSSEQRKIITDERDRRSNKLDKASKVLGVTSIVAGLVFGAIDLICNSSKKD